MINAGKGRGTASGLYTAGSRQDAPMVTITERMGRDGAITLIRPVVVTVAHAATRQAWL